MRPAQIPLTEARPLPGQQPDGGTNGLSNVSAAFWRRQISDRPVHFGLRPSAGHKPGDLGRRFGYRNVAGGHKALSTALLSGMVASHIEDHLASALEADETLVSAVIGATTQQKSDEAHRLRIESEQA